MGATPVLAGQRITASLLNGLPVAVTALTTGSVSNSASEAVIGTFTIPAGDAGAAVGSGYHFLLSGSADSAAGTATLTIRLRLNALAGTLISTAVTVTPRLATSLPFASDHWCYFTAVGASGTTNWNGYMNEAFTAGASASHVWLSGMNVPSTDTTSNMTFVVTAQWNAAAAGNVARTLQGAAYRI